MMKLNKKRKKTISILDGNVINNKIKYDFFEVISEEDINIFDNNKEILCTLKNGDILLRVGENLVSHKLPITISANISYIPLLRNGYIKQITDEKQKFIYITLFKEIIDDVSLKITSQFLTDFDSIYEFLRMPKTIEKQFITNVKALFN